MSKKRYQQLYEQVSPWLLRKGDKYYRLTHNEMCLGYHWCWDIRNTGKTLTGPGFPGYNPKCDCDLYDERSDIWNPKINTPYSIVKKDGQRPKD